MSFVVDQVRRIDSQLDRLQLSTAAPSTAERVHAASLTAAEIHDPNKAAHILQLQELVKSLTSTASRTNLVPLYRIRGILEQAQVSKSCTTCAQYFTQDEEEEEEEMVGRGVHVDPTYEHELEWLLLSKATVQVYGQVLNTILEQTIPLSEDIWYWDDILGTYANAGLYSVQTSPLRLWGWTKGVWHDVRARGRLAEGWGRFYGLVRDVVRERSMEDIQRRVVSPLAQVYDEARRKQARLKRIRQINANALGVLLGEGLSNDSIHEDGLRSPHEEDSSDTRHRWKTTTAKSIALMDAILVNVSDNELVADKFNDAVATMTQDDRYFALHERSVARTATSLKPAAVVKRLQSLLEEGLPQYIATFNDAVKQNGRPSRLIRYWLPATTLLISSTTIYRIAINRRAEILQWVRDFGTTVIDFWANWVVEPAKRILATIRHDEDSEVSILSKRSLEGDRASLERMVLGFAKVDGLNETQLADIRSKVREGDLTTVLKVYEKDMQSPVWGALRGNLIQALLIQVQKTKVDVEVAMSGIDSILKSQELLFGFIGLTPGVLVTIGVWRWLRGIFSSRRGLKKGTKQGQLLVILRNIDRILVGAVPTEFGELSYKDHGLLLCEVHLLRQTASGVLPRRIFHDFLEEIDELVDIRAGLSRQQKVVERMRWAYAKWFNV